MQTDIKSLNTKAEVRLHDCLNKKPHYFISLRGHANYSLTHALKIKQILILKEKIFKSELHRENARRDCKSLSPSQLLLPPQSRTSPVTPTPTRQVNWHEPIRVHRRGNIHFYSFFQILKRRKHAKQAGVRTMQMEKAFFLNMRTFHLL